MSNWTSGLILAIGGTFLFALKSIFIKLAYSAGATADEILLLRMLIAAPFYAGMLIYLRKNEIKHSPCNIPALIKILSLGFFGYYLASYLDLAGLTMISAQLERLTLFTYPTMIAILAWLFLGEKITRMVILSLVLCYLGLWVMYGQEKAMINVADGENVTRGVLLVLGSAMSYSLYVIFAKPLIQKYGSRFFTSVAMLGSTVFVCIHYAVLHPFSLTHITGIIWIYALALAFVCTVIPSFMITEAIARIGASRTSILGAAGPVFTIVLAVFIINEPFTIQHALGVVLVLIGVACVSLKK
ncbi:MAG: DMT family transporter [Akkermansiaceae bacterium]